MRDAGCCNIKMGIESMVERIQRIIGKVIPVDKIKSSFGLIKRYGMDRIAYFSLGHPGEKFSEMKETVNSIKKINPDYMDVTLCSPIPGSRLFDIAAREGKLPINFWSMVDKIKIMPIYVPDGITIKDMRQLQKLAYRKFYFSFRYFFHQLWRVKTLKELRHKIRLALLLWRDACN